MAGINAVGGHLIGVHIHQIAEIFVRGGAMITFQKIVDSKSSVTVQFGYKLLRLLGREWAYAESFDTVLFRIEYNDGHHEFRSITVPPRAPDGKIRLTL